MTSWSGSPQELLRSLSPAEIEAAPECLYWKGAPLVAGRRNRVAVVGSRRATAQGLAQAEAAS